jgi:hypothetical protein
MKAFVVSFLSGIVFALGLGISGMTRLAFVMIGAIAVYLIAYRLIRRRTAPLFAGKFSVPEGRNIDSNLLVGAALFGAGDWLAFARDRQLPHLLPVLRFRDERNGCA